MSLLKIRQFSIDQTDTFSFANANVSGNLVSGNASLGNLASANYFSGNGYFLTSTNGANVSGQVANALSAGTVYTAAQTNITSLGTLTGLAVSGNVDFTGPNVSLGNVANIKMFGGTAGQVLQSNGSGVISWYTPTSGTGNANIAGSNTQVFFNDNGSATLGAKSTFTFDKGTDTLTVTKVSANGALLTNITGANVDGNVTSAVQSHYANIANSVSGTNVSGNVTSAVQSHYANIANSVSGTNVSGNVTSAVQAHYANIANSVSFTNITSTPTTISGYGITDAYSNTNAGAYLTSVTFTTTGNITANVITANTFSGNGSSITYIAGGNVSGNVSSAVQSHYANIANSVAGANVSGQVANANVAYFESVTTQTTGTFYPVFVNGSANGNYALASNSALSFDAATGVLTTGTIQSGGGSGGNITGANLISANYFTGNGYLLTSTNGSNVTGNVTSAVQSHYANIANSVTFTNVSSKPTTISGYGITDAYSNTNAGAYLSSYTGELSAGNLTLTGNLIISGTTTSVNSTVTRVVDPLFELGGGANGAALVGDDNKDRGLLLHYHNGVAPVDAFMGWDDSGGNFVIASNVTVSGEVVTFNTYGDLKLGNLYANNANFGGVVFAEGNVTLGASSYFNGNVVGDVSGNISGNIKVDGANGSIQFATSVTNHFGPTINATTVVSGTRYKIITAGTSDFTTFGSANNTVGTIFTANATGTGTGTVQVVTTYGDLANDGSNLVYTSANLTLNVGVGVGGNVKTDNIYGTIKTTSQTDITTVGTLTGLTITNNGNIAMSGTASQISGGNLVSATYVTGTLTTAAQPNITSTGTLTSLTVTGNISAGNVAGGNLVSANYFSGNGSQLTSLTGVNVTGYVPNATNANAATTAGTVTTAAQGNITSVGTLTSLTVSGTTNLGAVSNVTITGGTANYFLKTDGAGVLSFASLPSTTMAVNGYTGDGSWTMQTLSSTPLTSSYLIVTIGGVSQPRSAFSLATNVITFSDPPPNGAVVEVIVLSGGVAGTVGYVYSSISSATSAVAGTRYFIDTTAAVTLTLPGSPSVGDEVGIIDATGNAGTQNITIARNGGNIEGSASNLVLTVNRSALTLVYYNATQGWIKTQK